jgi:hypothetical protein
VGKEKRIMGILRITSCTLICLGVLGCQKSPILEHNTIAPISIGVYDSRAIAVAAVGSEYYTLHVKPLEDAFRKAKADGNTELIKELEPKVWARRKETHRQGFSTAPVDNLLEFISDQMPQIAADSGVGPIISKWDANALAKYKKSTRVDVTMQLVDAFKPNAKQRKIAIGIQTKKPIPMATLEKHISAQGH